MPLKFTTGIQIKVQIKEAGETELEMVQGSHAKKQKLRVKQAGNKV